MKAKRYAFDKEELSDTEKLVLEKALGKKELSYILLATDTKKDRAMSLLRAKQIRDFIHRVRKVKKLSTEEFYKRCRFSVYESIVFETLPRFMPLYTLLIIMKVLDLSPGELFNMRRKRKIQKQK